MQKVIFSILALSLALSAGAQSLDRSVRPQPGPAPEIKIGESQSFTLPNGLRVFVVENHKLPVISCDIQLDIRPELEGPRAGYRDMMNELLLSGTKTRSKDKLNEEIDLIAANIGASSDEISGSCLKKHQDKLMQLMSDIAINADIKQAELDKVIKRTLSGLEAAKNEPDAMLQNVSASLNYGMAFPYGQIATENSVKSITLQTCRDYYSTYFRPNVAYMAIVGDVTMKEIKPLIEKYFGSWQKADVPVAHYGNPIPPPATRVAFVPRDAAVQSVINVTYPVDLKIGSDDVIKARVASTILGGGSQGRLFLNLREKHGWTYGSYSSIKDDELMGSFTAYAKCRNKVSDSSVAEILNEMNRIRTEKVATEDLQNCINYMSGGFALSLESPERIAQFAINIERYHMPKDYYKNYLKNLSAVTAEDVQAAAVKYINPEHANIVVVGNKDQAATMTRFASNGKLEYYDNYGLPIQVSQMMAADAGVTGDSVMKRYINAIGGEKLIMGIKDIKTIYTATIQGIPVKLIEIKKAPDKFMQSIEGTVQGQTMTFQKQVLSGSTGFTEGQGQKAEMTPQDVEDTKEEADIYADLHPEKYGIKRTVKGVEKINNKDAYVVEAVNAKGKKAIEYYDVTSGLLVKKVETEETPQGTISKVAEFSGYKDAPGYKGYKVPSAVKITNGPMVIDAELFTVDINKGVPDTKFN